LGVRPKGYGIHAVLLEFGIVICNRLLFGEQYSNAFTNVVVGDFKSLGVQRRYSTLELAVYAVDEVNRDARSGDFCAVKTLA
jgi:hypothetical protein